jgi:hypothetical protein
LILSKRNFQNISIKKLLATTFFHKKILKIYFFLPICRGYFFCCCFKAKKERIFFVAKGLKATKENKKKAVQLLQIT